VNIRAELKEARRHGFAEPGTASRHENASAGEKIFAEHGSFRLRVMSVNWSID
jgi:hypothetical protein